MLCQKQLPRTGTSNYIAQYLWDASTRPCPVYRCNYASLGVIQLDICLSAYVLLPILWLRKCYSLHDGTKTSPEPVLTNHQLGSVAFLYNEFRNHILEVTTTSSNKFIFCLFMSYCTLFRWSMTPCWPVRVNLPKVLLPTAFLA